MEDELKLRGADKLELHLKYCNLIDALQLAVVYM